jgi:hypothetical protein
MDLFIAQFIYHEICNSKKIHKLSSTQIPCFNTESLPQTAVHLHAVLMVVGRHLVQDHSLSAFRYFEFAHDLNQLLHWAELAD